MNITPDHSTSHDPFEPQREDVLIGRVIDGEASSADWESLDLIARSDQAIWERLGRAQRAHARLEREVDDAISLAELIDLPASQVASTSLSLRLQRYSGWAVAAALGLALLGTLGFNNSGRSPGVGPGVLQANIGPVGALSPDEALDQYVRSGLASGRVIGEMPAVLVDTRSVEQGGGQEVLFVRQILERKMVTDISVMSVEVDEHGTPRYVPMRPAQAPGAVRRTTGEPRAY